MSSRVVSQPSRENIYVTKWKDFVVITDYDRVLDLFITKVREEGKPLLLTWYCTDQWKRMEKQHAKGLFLCWKIIELSMGKDDF